MSQTTKEMMQKPEVFTEGVVKRMDVNPAKWAVITSLEAFGLARIVGKEMLRWTEQTFGNAVEISRPEYDDVSLEAMWLAKAPKGIYIESKKIRWANLGIFRYSVTIRLPNGVSKPKQVLNKEKSSESG